jgi:chromate transporter
MDPHFTLFWHFMLASMIAFGGSQSALPLIERIAVQEMRWASAEEFATAVGSSYVTPGPIGMVAAFIGFRVAGFTGAVAATLGMFLIPWLIAASAARMLQPMLENRWLRGFSFGATAAVVGLQAVIAVDLSRHATGSIFVVIGMASATLSLFTKFHPILIVLAGAAVGVIAG